ncbi:glycosyltransferase [Luedemannella flava]|uniref:glycosyltransferase n=1 Tax=Luedemannella flava TaxID=349316 RepID=UPI0031D03275
MARALVVICREAAPPATLIHLAERYLAFLVHAQTADGRFHNRLSYERRWVDEAGTGDWWGRAIWGLGTAAARAPLAHLRRAALTCFELACRHRSRWPRAMAFAGLGAAEILTVTPDHDQARRILADAVTTVGRADVAADWAWPEARLAYANAALAEVYLAAGQQTGDTGATDIGLRRLAWLLAMETVDGHLSPTPVGGRAAGEPRPGFDQQPIEAAALADACARALAMTGDARWMGGLRLAVDWFLGDNDARTGLITEAGGGSDGLCPTGRSDNQGAESTLAMLSTLQHARKLTTMPAQHDRTADRPTPSNNGRRSVGHNYGR